MIEAWSLRVRNHHVWLARVGERLVGPFASRDLALAFIERPAADGPAALAMSIDAGGLGDWDGHAFCIEDFDGDAEWCVCVTTPRGSADIYFGDSPRGPLPGLFHDWATCRAAVIAAKAEAERPSGSP